MKETQSDNYPEYGRPSLRVTENWLNHRLQRDSKVGIFLCPDGKKALPIFSRRETLLVFFPGLLSLPKNDGRESCCFMLNYGHLAIPSADIITAPFLLTSKGWHAAIWADGFAFESLADVFNIFLYQEVSPQNSPACVCADKRFLDYAGWVWNAPCRFMDLNTWPWVGGTVWEVCGTFTGWSPAAQNEVWSHCCPLSAPWL